MRHRKTEAFNLCSFFLSFFKIKMSFEGNSNGTITRLNGIGRIPSMSGVPREEDKNENVVKG